MTIIKSLGNTFLFLLLLNLVSCWILLDRIYLGLLKETNFLSVSKTSNTFYIWGFILGVVFVFAQAPLNIIYNELFGTGYLIQFNFDPNGLLNWTSIAGVIMIPVYEEFFFRKFIQRDLQKAFHPILAITFASILFASIHLPLHSLFFERYVFSFHHAYITFFGGLISGGLFYKSKSIGPSIVMHCFWNLCVYVF